MDKHNQTIRDGNKTLRRTVHEILPSGSGGFIEQGYIRCDRGCSFVKKTKPMTWWKLVRPARAAECT